MPRLSSEGAHDTKCDSGRFSDAHQLIRCVFVPRSYLQSEQYVCTRSRTTLRRADEKKRRKKKGLAFRSPSEDSPVLLTIRIWGRETCAHTKGDLHHRPDRKRQTFFVRSRTNSGSNIEASLTLFWQCMAQSTCCKQILSRFHVHCKTVKVQLLFSPYPFISWRIVV